MSRHGPQLFALLCVLGVSSVARAAAPAVSTLGAAPLSTTRARIQGAANPNGESTTGWFRFSASHPGTCNDSFGTRAPSGGGASLGSVSSHMLFELELTGLTAGTTYYYCAIAQNGSGMRYGQVHTFNLQGDPPNASTWSATGLSTTSATIEGAAKPNGGATTGWLRYSATNPGVCDDAFGTRVPSSGGTPLGAGFSYANYAETLSGLSTATTYYFCAIAQNASGISFGQLNVFSTPAVAPVVTTSAASSVTSTTVVLSGAANPNGASTTGFFRYSTSNPGTCHNSFGTRTPSSGGSALGSGHASVPFSQSLSGLQPGRTYYYCALGTNSGGTAVGAVQTFTTLNDAPTVSASATNLTASSATLTGEVNPNGDATIAWFRYSATHPGTCDDSFGTRAPASGGQSIAAGTSTVSYSESLTGLSPGTTWYVCAIARNALGTSFSAVGTFTTRVAPTVTTSAATSVTSSSATLNGAGVPNGTSTNGYFVYSSVDPGTCDATFGTVTPTRSLGSGSSAVTFNVGITGLLPGTTYYYCAVAQSAAGTAFGAVLTFTTGAIAPSVTTADATDLTGTTGTLNGSVNPGGGETTVWFRYSTTSQGSCNDSFGVRVPASGGVTVPASNTATPVSQPVTGLTSLTTYYVCAIASNSEGTRFGSVRTFIPPAAPIATTNAPPYLGVPREASLGGTVTPNRALTQAWFRISDTDPGTCNDTFGTRYPSTGALDVGSTNARTVSQKVTGLVELATYYYCVIANNVVGTSYGELRSFSVPAPPSVTTLPPTNLGSYGATFNAEINPNYAFTSVYFYWFSQDPGTCDGPGRRGTLTGGSLSAGNSRVAVSVTSQGSFTPGATFYFCARAENSMGVVNGAVQSFTMPSVAPRIETLEVTGLSTSSVTLPAWANPHGAATTGWFRYGTTHPGTCDDTFGTRLPATGGTNLGVGAGPVSWSETLTSLPLGTTFYYCALASNAEGTSMGSVMSFTTPTPPVVSTAPVSQMTGQTAWLLGTVNPRADATTAWFRYDTVDPGTCNDTFGTRAPTSSGEAMGAGDAPRQTYLQISGLTPGTTYYYCAIAANSLGTGFGELRSFTTWSPPTVQTLPAVSIANDRATIEASVNPNGTWTQAWFRYDTVHPGTCNDTFGTRNPSRDGFDLDWGTAARPVSLRLGNLTPLTTYYYCVIASNAGGVSLGTVERFTTIQTPVVTTEAATGVGGTTATLNAQTQAHGGPTTGWFRYSTAQPASCSDAFGARAPATGAVDVGAGNAPAPWSQSLTGLIPGSTYHYCAISKNEAGTAFGQLRSFVTPAAPTVTTSAATDVTSRSATLNGSSQPRGSATTGWFRLGTTNPGSCNDSFGVRAPLTGGTALGSGNNSATWSEPLTGLIPGTTYFFCAIAQNGIATTFGSLQTFTTPDAPAVVSSSASSVTTSSATLTAIANPKGAASTGYFRWGTTDPGTCNDTFGTRLPASGGTQLGSGTSNATYSQVLTGLSRSTTYYFCAVATSAEGTTFGSVERFHTQGMPAVTTAAASGLTGSSATLNGSANPSGSSSTGFFRYGTVDPGTCNTSFGTPAPSSGGAALGSGTNPVSFGQTLTGLTPGTTYFFCALATNAQGTAVGAVQSFTLPVAPVVTTRAATGITDTAATLNADANPRGSETTAWFRYGITNPGTCHDGFGNRTPATGGVALGSGTSPASYDVVIANLAPGTTWYVCAVAQNAAGKSYGSVTSFTTAAAPDVTSVAASDLRSTTATLNGVVVPNSAATEAWLRFSRTDPGTCDDAFGTRVPASGSLSLGAGGTAVPFSEAISGLQPNTTYYFCALASNALGARTGAVLSFSTVAAPSVGATTISGVTVTSARLESLANPNGAHAMGWFRFDTLDPGTCGDAFGTRMPASGGLALGNGRSAVALSETLTGLLPNTTYYACALASNAEGLSVGPVQSFTTLASAPEVTTLLARSVTGSTATLEGAARPNGLATQAWFRFSPTEPASCDDGFGVRVPTSGGIALGAGSHSVPFSETLGSLTPGTTWYYCALASNAEGLATGAVMSFQTPAAPSVVTAPITNVLTTSATLHGEAIPNGAGTAAWFRLGTTDPGTCDDAFGIRAPTTGSTSLGDGSDPVTWSQELSELTPGTTYYVCAVAQNAVGLAFGEVRTFRTLARPSVTTGFASAVTAQSARLNGTATPNGSATAAWFRYGTVAPTSCNDSFGARAPNTGSTSLGAGSAPVAFSHQLANLKTGVTYYFCAVAENAFGRSYGEVRTVQTDAPPPIVATFDATDVDSRSLTLNGTVNPNLSETLAWFRYGTTDPGECNESFGTLVPREWIAVGAGAKDVPLAVALEGLKPATTYFFCAIAGNLGGTALGELRSVTTGTERPVVTTQLATVDETGTVTLNGLGITNGLEGSGWFRYGTLPLAVCDAAFGQQTSAVPLKAGHEETPFSQALSGLEPGTYYYCAVVSTPAGETFGDVHSVRVPEGPGDVGCGCAAGTGNAALPMWLLGGMLLMLEGRRRRR